MQNHGRQGMTLIELIIAIGLFGVAALMCLAVLATSVERNRSTRLTVAATTAARQTMEETLAMANWVERTATNEKKEAEDTKPLLLCKYLLGDSLPDGFVVTRIGNPVQRIECSFPAMVPGELARDAEGAKLFDKIAEGESGQHLAGQFKNAEGFMTVYLDESQVPIELNGAVEPLWQDLSRATPARGPDGFDINGDGKIHQGGLIRETGQGPVFAASNLSSQDLCQLPVDVRLTYYVPKSNSSDPNDWARQDYRYRIIVTDMK